MSMAVWLRQRPSNPSRPEKPAGFLLPNLAAASALVILVRRHVALRQPRGDRARDRDAGRWSASGSSCRCAACRRLSQERHRQSVTDDLTGLGNRRYLFRVLDAFFADRGDSSTPDRRLAFLFVDLNHFKEINDSFGHPAGDQLLKQLGARLSSSLRTPTCSSGSVVTSSPSC